MCQTKALFCERVCYIESDCPLAEELLYLGKSRNTKHKHTNVLIRNSFEIDFLTCQIGSLELNRRKKEKKKIYLPQKQCVSKAKVGRICVIPSSGTTRGLHRKRQGAVYPVREKALDSYQVPITVRFNTYQ